MLGLCLAVTFLTEITSNTATANLLMPLLAAVAGVTLADGGSVTASIGIARHPEDGDDVDELVRKADVAMYAAKSAGGNRMQFYSQQLQLGAQSIAARRRDLELGLAGGQVVPFYQPIVRASDGLPVGVEVLARWRHP
ncbi:MAG TPA: diguanylate cyclase, partial [Actinotalea sp.]|nr:diguanylate cyclase [Actinotalea sp.]